MLVLIAFILKFMNKNVISEQLQNTSSLLRAKKNFRNISLSNVLVQVHFSAFPRLKLCCALKW